MKKIPFPARPSRGAVILILFIFLAVLAALSVDPAGAGPVRKATYETALRTYIARQMEEYKIPGLALAVVRDGEVQFMEGFGAANAAGHPVRTETPFLLASVSKGITALAVMQLVEAGELGLDDPVREHLPWFEVGGGLGGEITVAQLLYQTSGFTELGGREANLRPDGPDALEEAVRALAAEELTFAPGQGWEYSNLNYDVLGLLVQEVSGLPYGEYLETHIFDPLAMRSTYTSLEAARGGGAAGGYYPFFGIPLVFDRLMPYSRATLPSAGLWSSADDLSRYLIALLDGGRYGDQALLSEAGVGVLQTPGHMFHETQGYAMGWTVNHQFADPEFLAGTGMEEYAGATILFHEGDGLSYKAVAFLIPEIDYGMILLMNTNDPTVTSAFRFFGWDVALIALGAEPQYFPPAEEFAVRYARWIGGVVVLLMAAGLWWMVRRLRRGEPFSRAERLGAVSLASVSVLPAAYTFLSLLPDQSSSLPVVLRFVPDVGLLVLAGLALPVGLVWMAVRLIRR